ncbi:LppU/SCO3897 family protein [Micromonospora sp. DT15]|uniref:LppU/SCO3897 family protein n=1 Tax=Micromonospora sp. DT15 TaxID=3393445 RepID=UPI003CF09BD0
MPEQVAPPPAPDAANPESVVETPQAAAPQPAVPQQRSVEPEPAAATPQAAATPVAAETQATETSQAAEAQATETPVAAEAQATGTSQAAETRAAETQAAETSQATEPKAEKSGAKKVLGIVGAILVVVVIAGLKFGVASAIGNFFNKDATADAKTGDCIAELPEVTGTEQEEVDGAKVVACTSTDAAYNVVGRVDGQSEAQAKADTTCTQFFKEGQEGYIFSSIEPGKTGYVLCLTKKV